MVINRAVFLDRDGVITQDPPHYAHRRDQFALISGSAEAIKLLNENDFKVVVVSNQSGVARGYYAEADTNIFNQLMCDELEKKGAHIDAIYYCPHHPKFGDSRYKIDCDCRKPKPGMLLKAARELHIDLKKSFVIGDKISDVMAGYSAGCTTILVLTGHGVEEMSKKNIKTNFISNDLCGAVNKIILHKFNRPRCSGLNV
ncbi:MAG: D-glycero-beta-D-manno-heptose 1,7-bisphosphate 7-phosphatase [Clostridiales bacterium]|nr:D-glycero-beta-D-manno-heptose 1,7-bisphosphate 7-phosphatase [Clostridiales bacterium]